MMDPQKSSGGLDIQPPQQQQDHHILQDHSNRLQTYDDIPEAQYGNTDSIFLGRQAQETIYFENDIFFSPVGQVGRQTTRSRYDTDDGKIDETDGIGEIQTGYSSKSGFCYDLANIQDRSSAMSNASLPDTAPASIDSQGSAAELKAHSLSEKMRHIYY